MSLFEVNFEEIKRLDKDQLVELLIKLLNQECKHLGFHISDFQVTLNTIAGDEGIDGILNTENINNAHQFIPSSKTIYQVKADKMPPEKCFKEVSSNSVKLLRQKITEGFSYIIFCNKDQVPYQNKQKRVAKIKEGLNNRGINCDNITITFLDADDISKWVNKFLPIGIWVKRLAGLDIPGNFLPFSIWKNDKEFKIDFVSNDELNQQINDLTETILNNKVSRIVGLAGIGKTRRIYEAVKLLEPDIQDRIVYIPKDDQNTYGFFRDNEYTGVFENNNIFIIDDCSEKKHFFYQNVINKDENNTQLVTVDFCLPEYQSRQIEIDRLDDKIIENLIKSNLTDIDNDNLGMIVEFSCGNPRLALLIIEQMKQQVPEIGMLTEENLYERLLWRRDEEHKEISQKTIEICSLFDRVGFLDELKNEYQNICETFGVNANDFYSAVIDFKGKKIIQDIGRYITVQPLPLARHLISRWFKYNSPDFIRNVFFESNLDPKLIESFSKQMRNMGHDKKVITLIGELCEIPQGPFTQAEVLNTDLGSRIFCSFAELNPEKALDALVYAFKDWSIDDIKNNLKEGRRNIIYSLEKFLFHENLYLKSINLLYKLALGENETWSNNASGLFTHTFKLYLSGVSIPLMRRLDFLNSKIDNIVNEEEVMLFIKCLDCALVDGHFSRSGGAERQANKTYQDYQPQTNKEIRDYYLGSANILYGMLINENFSEKVKKEISDVLLNHIRVYLFNDVFTENLKILEKILEVFPDKLNKILNNIKLLEQRENKEYFSDVISYVDKIQPKIENLDDMFRVYVSGNRYDIYRLMDGNDFAKNSEKVNAIIKDIASQYDKDLNKLEESLEYFIKAEHNNLAEFARELGKITQNQEKIFSDLISIYKSSDISDPTFIAHFIGGLSDRAYADNSLKEILNDDILSNRFDLVYFVGASRDRSYLLEDELEIIKKCISEGKVKEKQLMTLGLGSSLERISSEYLINFFDFIYDTYGLSTVPTIVEIISMYSYRNKEKINDFKDFIVNKVAVSEDALIECAQRKGSLDNLFHLGSILQYLINNNNLTENECVNIFDAFCNVKDKKEHNISDHEIKKTTHLFFKKYPDIMYSHLFDKVINLESTWWVRWRDLIGHHFNNYSDYEQDYTVFDMGMDQKIIEFLQQIKVVENRNKVYEFISTSMNLLTKDSNDEYDWHPLIKYIILNCNDIKILETISSQISNMVHMGDTSKYYGKYVNAYNNLIKESPTLTVHDWANKSMGYINNRIKKEKILEEEWRY